MNLNNGSAAPARDMDDSEEDIHHVNNPVTEIEPVVKKYLSSVTACSQEGNSFYFTDGIAKVEVRIISDEIIRVRMAPQGTFLAEFSYALDQRDHKIRVFSLDEDQEYYRVSTGMVVCAIRKSDFTISFH